MGKKLFKKKEWDLKTFDGDILLNERMDATVRRRFASLQRARSIRNRLLPIPIRLAGSKMHTSFLRTRKME